MGKEQRNVHPCIGCGACCAFYRVAFYWLEAEPGTDPHVPPELAVDLDLAKRCMRGTQTKHSPKCVALSGRIGKDAHCSIYERRPTPCRQFRASYENGQQQPRCDDARMKHGLRALSKQDWLDLKPSPIDIGVGG